VPPVNNNGRIEGKFPLCNVRLNKHPSSREGLVVAIIKLELHLQDFCRRCGKS